MWNNTSAAKRNHNLWKKFPLLIMAYSILSACDNPSNQNKEYIGSQSNKNIDAEITNHWKYSTINDNMRKINWKLAANESIDKYNNIIGENPLPTTIFIRSNKDNIIVYIENKNLQYICSSYTETYINVKFDNKNVEKYRCEQSSTSEYGVAFIIPSRKFFAQLKKSHDLTIETEVFQRGPIQQHFDVSNLNSINGGAVKRENKVVR